MSAWVLVALFGMGRTPTDMTVAASTVPPFKSEKECQQQKEKLAKADAKDPLSGPPKDLYTFRGYVCARIDEVK